MVKLAARAYVRHDEGGRDRRGEVAPPGRGDRPVEGASRRRRPVHAFDLTLGDAARAALAADPTTYVEATFGDGAVERLVGVRLKGSTSFQTLDGKPNLRVSFSLAAGALRATGGAGHAAEEVPGGDGGAGRVNVVCDTVNGQACGEGAFDGLAEPGPTLGR